MEFLRDYGPLSIGIWKCMRIMLLPFNAFMNSINWIWNGFQMCLGLVGLKLFSRIESKPKIEFRTIKKKTHFVKGEKIGSETFPDYTS